MIRAAFLSFAMATPVLALPPLSDVAEINDGLRSVKIADEIRSHCGSISARMLVAWSTLDGLKRRARNLGYSAEQIEDFVKSKADRKRLEGEADAYMAARGVTRGDDQSYCALGRAEIQSGTPIGALLRER
ncbi:DUF5333 domain-containing protein [Primorskyibacter sp. S187A]|uniref:DUF5333 domain-containing protein n=1 Tax=Primorskyibacter sp. S187A TaxID=3415130 RepID=UPI003C7A48AA